METPVAYAPCDHELLTTCTCLLFDAEHLYCTLCGGEYGLGPNQIEEEAA